MSITEDQLRRVVYVLKTQAAEAAKRYPGSDAEKMGVALTLLATAAAEIEDEMMTKMGEPGKVWLANHGYDIERPAVEIGFPKPDWSKAEP